MAEKGLVRVEPDKGLMSVTVFVTSLECDRG